MRYIIFFFSALLLSATLPAQLSDRLDQNNGEQAGKSFSERLYYGGNFGLSLGSNTVIVANPLIGYRVTDKYSVGIGPNYTYISVSGADQHIYGGSLFNRYIIYDGIFAQAELEQLYYKETVIGSEQEFSNDFTALLVGGGIRQPLGSNAGLTLIVQYDILQDENSLYNNGPIIRGGVNIGF